jgi:hypothetical protein
MPRVSFLVVVAMELSCVHARLERGTGVQGVPVVPVVLSATQPVATHSGIAIKPPSTVARHQSLTTSGRLARVEQDTEDKCEDDGADFFFRDQEEGAEVKRVCDNTDRSFRLHVKTTAATSVTPTATLEADLTCKKYRSTKGKCKCPS